ncbi:hypothetical protein BLNAU_12397 [Blattamonas nauphoetae]|uniref:PUM-HD domain-containing protein n=1 Tax=Blattamonas nauphoetae TaxID=2049346 RepID=A0ABQ9XJZ5_9EUKA|nr:hypothetical protein BLNAU_12397 [Blattamonas nauphoetae]
MQRVRIIFIGQLSHSAPINFQFRFFDDEVVPLSNSTNQPRIFDRWDTNTSQFNASGFSCVTLNISLQRFGTKPLCYNHRTDRPRKPYKGHRFPSCFSAIDTSPYDISEDGSNELSATEIDLPQPKSKAPFLRVDRSSGPEKNRHPKKRLEMLGQHRVSDHELRDDDYIPQFPATSLTPVDNTPRSSGCPSPGTTPLTTIHLNSSERSHHSQKPIPQLILPAPKLHITFPPPTSLPQKTSNVHHPPVLTLSPAPIIPESRPRIIFRPSDHISLQLPRSQPQPISQPPKIDWPPTAPHIFSNTPNPPSRYEPMKNFPQQPPKSEYHPTDILFPTSSAPRHAPYDALRTPQDVDRVDTFSSFFVLSGKFNELLTTQQGCRFFQECVDAIHQQDLRHQPTSVDPTILNSTKLRPNNSLTDISLDLAFRDISPNFVTFSCDRFANYAIQVLIKYSSHNLLKRVITLLSPSSLFRLSTNVFGTHCAQSLITRVNGVPVLEEMIEKRFAGQCFMVLSDATGFHVIMCLLSHWSSRSTMFVVNELVESPPAIAARNQHIHQLVSTPTNPKTSKSRNYFALMQHVLTLLSNEAKATVALSMIPFVPILAKDASTNYLVQAFIKIDWEAVDLTFSSGQSFFSSLVPHFPSFAQNKIASNVANCLLTHCDSVTLSQLVSLLVSQPNVLAHLCLDQTAHHCILRLCSTVSGVLLDSLVSTLLGMSQTLQQNTAGRQVLSFCQQCHLD